MPLRLLLGAFYSKKKKKFKQKELELQNHVKIREEAYTSNPGLEQYQEMKTSQSSLSEYLNEKSSNINFFRGYKAFVEGGRPAKFLAQIVKSNKGKGTIEKIKKEDGQYTTDQNEITGMFVSYFSQLYNTEMGSAKE